MVCPMSAKKKYPRVPANNPGPLECRRIPGYSGPSDVLTRLKELYTLVAVVAGLARFMCSDPPAGVTDTL